MFTLPLSIDAAAKVSFVAPEFQFEETHAVVQVRFQRLCYTAGKTSVSCILKWGTATRDDFYIPDYPEVVVVPAGETDGGNQRILVYNGGKQRILVYNGGKQRILVYNGVVA